MAAVDAVPAIIPFNQIAPGASVRYTYINGKQYLSIRDLIMHMCDTNTLDYAGHIWRRLADEFKDDLEKFCESFQFPGRGQSKQPVITFPGAVRLSMYLPGLFGLVVLCAFANLLFF